MELWCATICAALQYIAASADPRDRTCGAAPSARIRSVVKVTSKLKNVTGKIKGKKRGYFESIGCGGKTREAIATFTDENGTSTPVTQDIGKC